MSPASAIRDPESRGAGRVHEQDDNDESWSACRAVVLLFTLQFSHRSSHLQSNSATRLDKYDPTSLRPYSLKMLKTMGLAGSTA